MVEPKISNVVFYKKHNGGKIQSNLNFDFSIVEEFIAFLETCFSSCTVELTHHNA